MTTVVSYRGSGGEARHCNAACYDAKGKDCTCICGGMNHGGGLDKAMENTAALFTHLLEPTADPADWETHWDKLNLNGHRPFIHKHVIGKRIRKRVPRGLKGQTQLPELHVFYPT